MSQTATAVVDEDSLRSVSDMDRRGCGSLAGFIAAPDLVRITPVPGATCFIRGCLSITTDDVCDPGRARATVPFHSADPLAGSPWEPRTGQGAS